MHVTCLSQQADELSLRVIEVGLRLETSSHDGSLVIDTGSQVLTRNLPEEFLSVVREDLHLKVRFSISN